MDRSRRAAWAAGLDVFRHVEESAREPDDAEVQGKGAVWGQFDRRGG